MTGQAETSRAEYEEYEDLQDYFDAPRTRKAKPKRTSLDLLPGVVTRARGHHYDVQIEPVAAAGEVAAPGAEGEVRMCEVRGRLLQEKGRDTLVAVGDRVWVRPDGPRRGLIERVDERHSVLSRQHPGVSMPAEDVILANPDQALMVFSVAQPEPHLRMLDRFLVMAEANELPAVICANKIDLVGQDGAIKIFGRYADIGYHVIYASAQTGAGIAELKECLTDAITVLTGPSGVGKSSLLNAVHPALRINVGDLREVLDRGRHTTRGARLFRLPLGVSTYVADTPGIREMGLYDIDPQNLGFYFREFAPYIHECKFPNCTHDHEPGCAVAAAAAQGKIHAERYDSYLRLLHGEE